MSNPQDAVIVCESLAKTYKDGKLRVDVFSDINLSIQRGEQVAIIGSSGEGKSTLLHLLGGLDKPSSGNVIIDGVNINQLSEAKRCRWRNLKLGFVYQLHHLLPEFTVLENVCMPLLLRKGYKGDIKQKGKDLLAQVGLEHRLEHKPGGLSGGERQRTAIIRAMVADPVCIFADEPTGNLDHKTASSVYETMLDLNRRVGTSLLIVTHDMNLARRMDRILLLEDGQLREQAR